MSGCAVLAMAGLPTSAGAHSFGVVYTLPVPFWLYAWTAAAALVVSFVIAGIFLTGAGGSGTAPEGRRTRGYRHRIPAPVLGGLQVLSLAGLALCIATGFLGTRQSYTNFNMTFFWIVFVLGFAYATAVFGNVYGLLNPWRLLCTGISRVFPAYGRGRVRAPHWLGCWPAIALYGAFIWYELFGRSNPFSLALWLSAYTGLNLLAVACFGARYWFRNGELFAVFLRLVGRMAPVEFEVRDGRTQPRFRWRWPFSGLLHAPAGHPTLLLFMLFMLSATAFDGLHESKPWVQLFWTDLYREVFSRWVGDNPFAAYRELRGTWDWWQTGWLLASPFVYFTAYLGTIELMRWLTGRRHGRAELAGAFAPSLLPIVLVYHVTHYYTLIQTQGVKIIAMVSDPFGFGWNLFGTATWMRGSIVPDMNVVWHVQVGLLLFGHIVSVVVAHLVALRVFGDRRRATLSQLPMLALMVAFTVFGLWILSLPLETVVEK